MNAPFHFVPHAEPFFFDVDPGTRFCMYHPPGTQVAPRGAILYVHPFADELNLCRRMAAQQARAFAAMGFAVLQVDLFGCGDSCGDFSSGRWEQWQRDLDVAAAWLLQRQDGPLYLWGIRLGALLAMEMASPLDVAGLILWQPMISGRTAINQFLRQQLITKRDERASGGAAQAAGGKSGRGAAIRTLRAHLDAAGHADVNGFDLDLAMVRSIEASQATAIHLRPCAVHWFSSAAMPRRLATQWREQGLDFHHHQVPLLPFWSDAAYPECPALLAATCAALAAPDDPAPPATPDADASQA